MTATRTERMRADLQRAEDEGLIVPLTGPRSVLTPGPSPVTVTLSPMDTIVLRDALSARIRHLRQRAGQWESHPTLAASDRNLADRLDSIRKQLRP